MKPQTTQPLVQREKPALLEYANISSYPEGTPYTPGILPSVPMNIENTLRKLQQKAMPETWEYSNMTNARSLPILYNYIIHTFARIKEEDKLCEQSNFSCFNTGLVTPNQEEIFMLFKRKNENSKWQFRDFCTESSASMSYYNPLPERASYFSNSSELIYDTTIDLRIRIDHIVDDPENFARFPEDVRNWSKHQLINTFNGAIEHAKKRVRRNYLTAIPQYYRGKYTNEPKLQLLLPLCLKDPSKADLALAVYRSGDAYYGKTCLTLDMAINNARLIAKPGDEWLKP